MSASMDLNNIQSIISQNISLINFLDFVALKLLLITEILLFYLAFFKETKSYLYYVLVISLYPEVFFKKA
jgi:hypothetical protein